MTIFARRPLAPLCLTLLLACSGSGTTSTSSESDSDGSTVGESATTGGATTDTTTAGPGTTSSPGTTNSTTTGPDETTGTPTSATTTSETTEDPSTSSTTTEDPTTGDMTDTATTGEPPLLECLSGDIMAKEGVNVMEYYGAPCMDDADCVPLIGPDAICIPNILDTFDAPGGYCTRPCEQPDDETFESPNFPGCKGGGEASCIGANGIFTACAFPCTSSDQCHREGYVCRTVPLVNSELKYCLMPDACCLLEDGCNF